jgi:hypothetical protein
MFWADRTTKAAGLALLLLVTLAIVNIVLVTLAVGDADPTKRGDIEEILRDINGNEALFFLGSAFSIATDAVALLVVGALLFLVFRDRSPLLALLGFAGLVGSGVAFLAADAANLTVAVLAADFVQEGGPAGIAAGDPVILQSARAVAAFSGFIDPIGSTTLGLALLSIGALIAWAPNGEVNPPRWLGALGLLAGLGNALTWVFLVAEAVGIVLLTIAIIATLLLLVILGVWLLIQPEQEEARPAVS